MRIQFENLQEIKQFILMVDIYQLTEKVEKWGSKGYIITDTKQEGKEQYIITRPEDSCAFEARDKTIVTPYVRQISWLFKTLCQYIHEHDDLLPGDLLENFMVLCKGYFIMNPHYYPQELMLYILDRMQHYIYLRREEMRERKETF